MKRILLIEDDKDLNTGLTYDLESENYKVFSALTLGDGMSILSEKEVDLILLDGNLPDGDGFDFCRSVKSESDIPVIFLTARDMDRDEMQGFDCGADDYITKPFNMPILHRRIKAALRKAAADGGERIQYDDGHLKIDFDAMAASLGGEPLTMTPTEFKILRLLIANAERVMTKTLLLEKVWDSTGNFVDEHAVAVNINRLRKKIESEEHPYIKTLYGMGYQWKGKKTEWKN
ncbi:response regulator transcription factor [Blautia marasmi]|uniref:response regulator transcription factor n=1 Tax=Blautia marasmi TaxID=1917868 RepID=UPI00266C1C75|nr:response regulator transcription factor [Blautia marasmi]